MKISYNWLSQYIHLSETPEEISELLTSVGLEVEGLEKVESIPGSLAGLVVGEVMECTKHPDADKLNCTKVNIGSGELLPIVCGAPNVAIGQKVIVATVGTELHPISGDSFTIKKAKIRGEVSEGMICAEDEIGTGKSHDGIMILPADTKIGTPVAEIFNIETDYVFEIGLTPNRADAASHYGVARDLKAVLAQRKNKKIELCRPSLNDFKPANTNLTIPVKVENTEACPRYVGVTVSNVKVAASPEWLQNRLKAVGVRPINNVVDITNYINHAFGQPLHAFDADKISGGQVLVKTLPTGTKFTTLDAEERELNENDLMICNADGGMCIAGVFGGAKSGVTENTKNIFIESAYFNPVWVRKTAKRHALNTDASFRFERGIDPNITLYAAKLAAQMMVEITHGEISSDVSDTHPELFPDFQVDYRIDKANAFIGIDIPETVTETILTGLDMQVAAKEGSTWKLSVPPFKVDVTREVDVIEEVLRIFGYDEVPFTNKIRSSVKNMRPSDETAAKETVTKLLTSNGFLECMSNSMTDEKFAALSTEWQPEEIVILNNPLSSELGIMRPALVFSAMINASYNLNRQQTNIQLFEFGNVYKNKGEGFKEETRLSITVSGLEMHDHWRVAEMPNDWYALKSALEQILKKLGINTAKLKASETTSDWFSYGLDWKKGEKTIISAGCIGPKLKKGFELKKDMFYLELRWNELIKLRQAEINIGALPKYPEVRRDFALLLDKAVEYSTIENLAYQTERKLLKEVFLFDVYEGKGLPEGKKSYAVSFALRDENKTLTDQEVDNTMKRLFERFNREVGAELR
ncbi:MAG: phenylalanine--tRNA ligase subunit beta [Salibacteraceae bacterium]|jgi:phenylalanyl-tRNA synthetase beta chain|nr:phenylalanine--tRNA ligase subunit beta [Salibacteraceae bacterium]